MSGLRPPLEDVVKPEGSPEGDALWRKVADFIGGVRVHPFEALALEAFRFQFRNNALYGKWCRHLGWTAERVATCSRWQDIPMLPVEAFRWGRVRTEGIADSGAPVTFRTSGTTGTQQGVQEVHTPALYAMSATAGFEDRFGPPGADRVLLGLLPGYLERPDSSLVHMVQLLRGAGWMEAGARPEDGFFLDDVQGLFESMEQAFQAGKRPILIGVTWALVDAAAAWRDAGRNPLADSVDIIVTGGMKGRREEWVAERVRSALMTGFGATHIGGEYGMTELLSQAWSIRDGIYSAPDWMRVRLRRTDDPLSPEPLRSTGAVDVVDLANIGSCCFLSTQDLARATTTNGGLPGFELLGRFDHAEVRGCNLLVQ